MNSSLVEAVIATFREDRAESHRNRLCGFTYRTWVGIYGWLDASGLALYFLARVHTLGIEAAIPVQVLSRLERNAIDNRKRMADMFDEFVAINHCFKKAGLSYVNYKGFTLAPDACPDMALRCQLDLDFLMSSRDRQYCESILRKRGYSLVGKGPNSEEFKALSKKVPSVRNLYRAKAQRSIEIHFMNSSECDSYPRKRNLAGLRSKISNGAEFPVLSDLDRFLGHALHVFKHLKSEWTRASWVLEYANFVRYHKKNETLWLEIERHLRHDPKIKIAVGVATLIAERSFGLVSAPETLKWSMSELPPPVRLWTECYGNNVLMAKFPGTKLYLLLLTTVSGDEEGTASRIRTKLLPSHKPPRITVANKKDGMVLWLGQHWSQAKYFCFRLKFHLQQGVLYKVEEIRWKRSTASL